MTRDRAVSLGWTDAELRAAYRKIVGDDAPDIVDDRVRELVFDRVVDPGFITTPKNERKTGPRIGAYISDDPDQHFGGAGLPLPKPGS
jgi:hypothetical protein